MYLGEKYDTLYPGKLLKFMHICFPGILVMFLFLFMFSCNLSDSLFISLVPYVKTRIELLFDKGRF